MFFSAFVRLTVSCLTSLLFSFLPVSSPWLSLTHIKDRIQFSFKERVSLDITFGLINKPSYYKQSRLQMAFETTILKGQGIVTIMQVLCKCLSLCKLYP